MSKINSKLEEFTTNILLNNDMLKIPVDVLKIAKLSDIEVYGGDLDKNISGAIRYDKETKKFAILINKNDSVARQRFTIAHELGHFFLHKEILENNEIHIDTMYRTQDKKEKYMMTNEKEKEVDYFAGALLMNKTLLEKMYESNNSITELAEIFKVSVSAMTVRLDILNLL